MTGEDKHQTPIGDCIIATLESMGKKIVFDSKGQSGYGLSGCKVREFQWSVDSHRLCLYFRQLAETG